MTVPGHDGARWGAPQPARPSDSPHDAPRTSAPVDGRRGRVAGSLALVLVTAIFAIVVLAALLST